MSKITNIEKEKLQLVGVTSLLLACKYEEIFSPEIRDFVCILDKSYQKDDLMIMENYMMKMGKFIKMLCQMQLKAEMFLNL